MTHVVQAMMNERLACKLKKNYTHCPGCSQKPIQVLSRKGSTKGFQILPGVVAEVRCIKGSCFAEIAVETATEKISELLVNQ